MGDLFESSGKNAELQRLEETKERIIELEERKQKEEIINLAKKKKRELFGKLGRFFGPKSEEIKFRDAKKCYFPYWHLSGSFKCDWLNEINYPLPVSNEVKYVKIGEKIYDARQESLKFSDILDKWGISVGGGIGPISAKMPISSFIKHIGKDKVLGSDKHVLLDKVVEFRRTEIPKKICIDARSGNEDKKIFELIENFDSKETQLHETPPISRKQAINTLWKKFEETHKRVNNEAEEIKEQIFEIDNIALVFIPHYEVSFECKGKTKSSLFCAVDGTRRR